MTHAVKAHKHSGAAVFLAFLAMGFADAAGPIVGLAREQFQLSNFAAQLIPFVNFLMFGLLSVPVGVCQARAGKKRILMLGLAIMLVGMLIPTLRGLSTFPLFLFSILLLGAGATTLQVAGNPIMRDVSAEGKYSRNLSLAQFVKAIGSLSGPLIPVIAARAFGAGWDVIFPVYSVAILAAIIGLIPLRAGRGGESGEAATFRSCLALLKNRDVAMMVLAIFLYVGAEVSVSSAIPLYLRERFQLDISRVGLLGTGLFFLALTVGRFSGGVVLNWMKPAAFFAASCGLSVIGLLGMFIPSGTVAAVSFVLTGLGIANLFPLIFSITVDRNPTQASAVS